MEMRNTRRLFDIEPTLTLPFVTWYAARHWDFLSARTVALALRILRQAGILISTRYSGEQRRTLGYTLAPHGMTLPTFVWCLYDKMGEEAAASGLVPYQIEGARFVKTFVVPPSVAAARLAEAERAGVVEIEGGKAKRITLPLSTADLVEALIQGRRAEV